MYEMQSQSIQLRTHSHFVFPIASKPFGVQVKMWVNKKCALTQENAVTQKIYAQ